MSSSEGQIKKVFEIGEKFITNSDKFYKEWKLEYSIGKISPYKITLENARKEVNINEDKRSRTNLHCLVFGSVNNGKSAIINAVLGKEVMISRNGDTTNSFVEIKKSENNEDYIIFPDNTDKKENISLISRVDEADINHVEGGSHVKVYLSEQSCPLLEDNIVLVDSPGFDSEIEIDKKIKEECKKADVLILVISSSSGFSIKVKAFLKKYKTHFMNFKLIFLCNFSDTIWNEYEYYKEKFNKNVSEYLHDIYKEKTDKDEGIFFISAKERLKCQNKESISKDGWQRRNEYFEDFIKCLKTYKKDIIKKKHLELKKHNIEGIKNMYEEIKKAKDEEVSKFMENIKSIMKNETIKEIIKIEIGLLFKEINEKLVLKGQKQIEKLNEKDETIIEDELYIFDRNELMEIKKSYESKIMNKIKEDKMENEYQIMKILETIYFPLYFNFVEDLKEDDVKMLCRNYKEMIINQKAEEKSMVELKDVEVLKQTVDTAGLVGAGLSTVGTVGGVAVGAVKIAITAGVVVVGDSAFDAAFDAACVVLVLGVVARIGYISYKYHCSEKEKKLKIRHESCKNKCEEHKNNISSFWKEKEEEMINAYQTFLNNMEISMSFEDDFKTFEESVKNLI